MAETAPHKPFAKDIQLQALARQKYKCASCMTKISDIGEVGKSKHKFGERVEGHHVIPHMMKGPLTVDNCVVLCRSCHISAHQGGNWRNIAIYEDISKLPIEIQIGKIADLYPCYRG